MKKYICIISLLFFCLFASAQQKSVVRGVVKDASGQPVSGAVVMVEGQASMGTMTDDKGAYVLDLKSMDLKKVVLNVSCISYKTIEEALNGRSTVDFVLVDDSRLLDEVVVVGYGAMKRSDLTGSVASVRIEEDMAARSTSIDQLLQGRAAGVQVLSNSAAPDAGVNIRIRGLGSFNGTNEPLYVLDGIIINAESRSQQTFTQGVDSYGSDEETNGLMGINPQDIASVEILKDASATAIYGSQGANGVVLITTKTAKKQKPTVTLNIGVDVSQRYKKMDMLSFDEFVDYLGLLTEVAPEEFPNSSYTSLMKRFFVDPETREELKVTPVDWQDYAMRTAISQRYYLSVAGRPDKTSYMFSLGYNSKQGIVKQTDVNQFTGRLNLDRTIAKNLKIGMKTSFAYVTSNLTQGAQVGRIAASSSFIRSMLQTRPVMYSKPDEDDDDSEDVSGPNRWLNDFVNKKVQFRVTPSFYAEWKALDWLTVKSTFGGDYSGVEQSKFKSQRISTTTGNIAASAHSDAIRWNWDNLLMFNKKFGRHSLSGTIGMSMSSVHDYSDIVEGWGIAQYFSKENSINSAPNANMTYTESRSALMSYFARAIYNYDERYILTATYRVDGSSRFQGKNKWAMFPSFAFAWRINQEPWFNVDAISSAKLRLGWGQVGNQAIPNYRTLTMFTNSTVGDHSNAAGYGVSLYPSGISNPDLKWETTESWNAGLDIGLWKGRLALSVDVYDKMTKDLLQQRTLSQTSGFEVIWMNSGAIRNRGLELTLDTTPVKTKNFEWNLSGNISFNRNQIVSMGEGSSKGHIYMSDGKLVETAYFYGSEMSSTAATIANIFMEGYPVGLFYAYKTDGIVQVGETGPGLSQDTVKNPGSYKYVDMDGDGYITSNDRTIVGDPNPDFTYGFDTSFHYKRLSLGLNFVGSYGNDIFNLNNLLSLNTTSYSTNVSKKALQNAWTPENSNSKYAAVGMIKGEDANYYKDIFVEDGSYLRLANVSLSYAIPFKKKAIKSINLGVSAGNVFVFTKYSGYDPDVNVFGSNLMRMGVDFNSYPSARSYTFDVKFTF